MFALIENGRVVGYDVDPCPHGEWLPVSQVTDAPFDPTTHTLEPYDVRIDGGVVYQRARPVRKPIAEVDTSLNDFVAAIAKRLSALEDEVSRLQAARPAGDISTIIGTVIEEVDARLASFEMQAPTRPAPTVADDMPAFLRRHAAFGTAAAGVVAASSPDAEAVINAMNEIETAVTQRLDDLTARVSEISQRLDMPALPLNDDADRSAINTIEDWLREIDSRAAHADAVAASIAAEQERLKALLENDELRPVEHPVHADKRSEAIAAIRAAAKARRDQLIGETADDRDLRQRLTEIGLNAGSGHEKSVAMLSRLADSYAMTPDDMRRALIAEHDKATAAAVDTTVVESASVTMAMAAPVEDLDRIAAEAIDAIARVGA